MGIVLELLKSAKDSKELQEMFEECKLLADDVSLALIKKIGGYEELRKAMKG